VIAFTDELPKEKRKELAFLYPYQFISSLMLASSVSGLPIVGSQKFGC
jgi:hypothetical protein